MLKTVHNTVWAFDAEWVPNLKLGMKLHNTDDPDEALELMYKKAGATEENPTPYLKVGLCQLVSVSVLQRSVTPEGIKHTLISLPKLGTKASEKSILRKFFGGIAKRKPQLVGYNSISADFRIMLQRGLAHGLQASAFAAKPNKPWEGFDYSSQHSDAHIDLQAVLHPGWGSNSSLNDIAVSMGVPGKLDTSGDQVFDLWQDGDYDSIIAYNETDALTTFGVFLRLMYFSGFLTEEKYIEEQAQLRAMLEAKDQEHINKFLKAWL